MIQKTIDDKHAVRFRRMLESSGHIVITCHVRPDGDAMGSTLGLYHLLKALDKNAKVITPDTPPQQLRFMAKAELFRKKIAAWFFRTMGAFPVERGRGDLHALDEAGEIIREGSIMETEGKVILRK